MKNTEIKIIEIESKNIFSIRKKMLWKDAAQEMPTIYGELMEYANKNQIQIVSAPISLAHQWDENGGDVELGIVFKGENKGNHRIKSSKTYAGKVAVIEHIGAYSDSSNSWQKLFQYIKDNSLVNNGVPWEEYITDPKKESDQNKYITNLYQPIK